MLAAGEPAAIGKLLTPIPLRGYHPSEHALDQINGRTFGRSLFDPTSKGA